MAIITDVTDRLAWKILAEQTSAALGKGAIARSVAEDVNDIYNWLCGRGPKPWSAEQYEDGDCDRYWLAAARKEAEEWLRGEWDDLLKIPYDPNLNE